MSGSFVFGYNTNGLAHHDPFEAVELLAEIGYGSVGLTLDHACLSPYRATTASDVSRMRDTLSRLKMRSVIETGARFLLDRNVKHEPTLMSAEPAGRARRIDFYRRAIDLAAELRSDCVSLWSGVLREDLPEAAAWDRLTEGLESVLKHAEERNIPIGFEPEPGMFLDTMRNFDRLLKRLASPYFKLTLDIGHLHCQGELPLADYILFYTPYLVNVHIEDMRRGVHEHLPFGSGEMDFQAVLRALAEGQYAGGVHVELSRHSHDGPHQARESFRFLQERIRYQTELD